MEEMKNGMISEEALDEVAGGLKVDKSTLTKALKVAGVGIGILGAASGIGYVGKKVYDKKHSGDSSVSDTEEVSMEQAMAQVRQNAIPYLDEIKKRRKD